MEFAFTEEQALFAQTVRRFALDQLLPHYATWDDGTPFPQEKLKALADLGIVGLRVPQRFGGADASFVMAGIAAEELARGDFNTTYYLQIAAIVATLLSDHATDSVQNEWLPQLAAGDATLAFGLTEPGAGSDAANIQTRARRDADTWLVAGEKASITFAGIADACVVFARSGDEGAHGISAVLVPLHQAGVTRQVYPSFGSKLTARGSLFLCKGIHWSRQRFSWGHGDHGHGIQVHEIFREIWDIAGKVVIRCRGRNRRWSESVKGGSSWRLNGGRSGSVQ